MYKYIGTICTIYLLKINDNNISYKVILRISSCSHRSQEACTMASSPMQAERIAEEFSFLRPAASYGAGFAHFAPHRLGDSDIFQADPAKMFLTWV